MVIVSLQEFQEHTAQWLFRVREGEALQIEENGTAIATVQPPVKDAVSDALEKLRALGQQINCNLSHSEIKAMVEEGRR